MIRSTCALFSAARSRSSSSSSSGNAGRARDEAAASVGVSPRYVQEAKAIEAAAPEFGAAVRAVKNSSLVGKTSEELDGARNYTTKHGTEAVMETTRALTKPYPNISNCEHSEANELPNTRLRLPGFSLCTVGFRSLATS